MCQQRMPPRDEKGATSFLDEERIDRMKVTLDELDGSFSRLGLTHSCG